MTARGRQGLQESSVQALLAVSRVEKSKEGELRRMAGGVKAMRCGASGRWFVLCCWPPQQGLRPGLRLFSFLSVLPVVSWGGQNGACDPAMPEHWARRNRV